MKGGVPLMPSELWWSPAAGRSAQPPRRPLRALQDALSPMTGLQLCAPEFRLSKPGPAHRNVLLAARCRRTVSTAGGVSE